MNKEQSKVQVVSQDGGYQPELPLASTTPPKQSRRTKRDLVAIIPKGHVAQTAPQSTPDFLLQMAIDKNVDLDRLERLIAMKKDYDKEEARKKFIEDFSKFQGMLPEMVKNKLVEFKHKQGEGKTEYRYQELADIIKHIKEPAKKCGLAYDWEQEENQNGMITVTCIITHIGGHEKRGKPLSGMPDVSGYKNSIQQKGSTISYLQRYTLTAILGIASSDDNDGQGAAKAGKQEPTGKSKLTNDQIAEAVRKILKGEKNIAYYEEHADLEPEQRTALEVAEKSRSNATKTQ